MDQITFSEAEYQTKKRKTRREIFLERMDKLIPWKQLRHDKPARKVVKRSRWLLLRNRDNLKAEQAVKLEELLQANQPLMTVYLLTRISHRSPASLAD